MALALLVAARKDDIKIARCILEENVFIAFDIVDQAVEEGLTTLFEVNRDIFIIILGRMLYLNYFDHCTTVIRK